MRTTCAASDPGAAGRPIAVAAVGCLILAATILAGPARAEVRSSFVDSKGEAADEAVIALTPLSGAVPPTDPKLVIIDQIDKEYVPRINPIVVGTRIRFPNKDDIHHHVYSMSTTKKFELQLYEGTPADPVTFDKPGVVVLGCNIHDWMRAYIYVFETPYFAVAGEDGSATIARVPAGDYEVQVWHPRQQGDGPLTRRVKVEPDGDTVLEFVLDLKRTFGARRAPRGGDRKYR